MTSRVAELYDVITPERMATQITEKWIEWDGLRRPWKSNMEEVMRYVYATNTSQTTNSKLPWKNKTTVPKLCQIMDNLYANYTATMFPQRKSMVWEADESDSNSVQKRDAIVNYMSWAISQPSFKHEINKVILDYIQMGNCMATVEWIDQRNQDKDKIQAGYVGPAIRRINPMDMVMNPTAENFLVSQKIVKSLITMGELKELLQRMSNDENQKEYEELFSYLKNIRHHSLTFQGDYIERDGLYQMDGFGTFRNYLQSDLVEVLTFYGDIYDRYADKFYKNHVITVVDRHRLIGLKPNPSFFGYPPIFHAAWRAKQDNLWGMGPLDNLVGMQYRMDHVENMKADIYDLVTYPVQKIKGFVQDYTWQPGEKIQIDDEGDVEMVVPDVNALNANFEIQNLERLMEEMAGAPREAMGFRTPGEKTKYEVQSLENASARVFQNKIKQFEELMIEPLLNAMLELARRNITGITTIKVLSELDTTTFETLSVEDITGIGRIKPIAARHFAEQAQLVQNLTSLASSNLWPVVQPHFSGVKLAKIFEDIFNLKDFNVVRPFVALAEQADAQKQANSLQEQVMQEMGTATGIGHDYDLTPDVMNQMTNVQNMQTQQQQQGPQ